MNRILERRWLGTFVMLPDQILFQPPTQAANLFAEFWRLEKEAEKLLEGQKGLA